MSMKSNNFIFTCVNLLQYKCHKINLNCGGSSIGSPNWIKSKKATTSSINDNDKCSQYTAAAALNHEEIRKNSQKIKSFINKYNWRGLNYPSGKDDWKKVWEK